MFRSTAVLVFTLLVLASAAPAAEPAPFPRSTIDLGTVVGDLERSVRFYEEAIGFREVKGFDVPAQVAADAGLTDGKPLAVRVLKLMQVADTTPRAGDNEFIHSHTGFRYLTIMVADTDAALERLRKFGAKPLGKSPVPIPETIAPPGLFLTCVRDPDGNIVELIGPRSKR
jgi:lactoylglutathione lyase